MSFPKIKRHPWRKAKTLAMLANRRQWAREFDPSATSEIEILLENGVDYLVSQASVDYAPTYIITE